VVSGLGFSELLVVVALVLIFFGSKELPRFLRETGRLVGKFRRYSDRVRRELNEVTRALDVPTDLSAEMRDKKKAARKKFKAARSLLSDEERGEKSEAVCRYLLESDDVRNAKAVMIYVSVGSEVQTRACIEKLSAMGKRVVVPYLKVYGNDLGMAEITDAGKDLEDGAHGVPEPVKELRDNFFRSDPQLIVCPGVAYDTRGARLGRGKACYDNFLRELRGKVRIVGLGFECQVSSDLLPFDYHDITMDQVITEKGPLIGRVDDALAASETQNYTAEDT